MCGIFAIVGNKVSNERVAKALQTLRKRGPDDQGTLSFPLCTLAQTRLAVVDLSPLGHQPMQNAQAPHAITFNGEIYGYLELRKKLEERGHTFSSHSDTETILKAYAEYGTKCVQHLDGMFAFTLWDNARETLFLARDRFGKKPLYYAYDESGQLVVASEVKALMAYGIVPKISAAGIDAYLALMYLPPTMTFFENIYTLPPGHTALYKNGTLTVEQYFALETKAPLTISYGEALEETKRLLHSAVKKRMVADVEIGAFLSGGVDSTLITSIASEYSSHPIKTFSIGYGEHINELPFAKEAADTIGTDHHTREIETAITDVLEDVLAYMDEPQADSANLAQSILSEFASSKVKVALSGDGGDELFMGYGTYFAYYNRPKLVTLKNALFSNQLREHMKSMTVFPKRMRTELMKEGSIVPQNWYLPKEVSDTKLKDERAINHFDLTCTLPGMFLTKVDRMSMMHGLEVRSPLLDIDLARFAFSLPVEYKMSHKSGKRILKDILAETMPRTFVDRKKQGFGAPVRKWLQTPDMRAYVSQKLQGANVHTHEHIEKDELSSFVTRTLAGDDQKSYYRLWVILCLELWLRAHHNETL